MIFDALLHTGDRTPLGPCCTQLTRGALLGPDDEPDESLIATSLAADPQTLLMIDIEHWPTDMRKAPRAEVNRTLQKFRKLMQIVRRLQPWRRVVLYGFPVKEYWNHDIAWEDANRAVMVRAWEVADCITHGLYLHYTDGRNEAAYLRQMCRVPAGYGIQFLPCVWDLYHGWGDAPYQPLTADRMRGYGRMLKDAGVEDVIAWGGWSDTERKRMPWDQAVADRWAAFREGLEG